MNDHQIREHIRKIRSNGNRINCIRFDKLHIMTDNDITTTGLIYTLRGYTIGTIRNQLKDIRNLTIFFQQQGLVSLSALIPEDFDRAWQYFHKVHPNIAGTTRQLQKFLDQTLRLPQPFPIPLPLMLCCDGITIMKTSW